MKNTLKRAGWLLLVVLFVGTGLGIGVWAFVESIRQKDEPPAQITSDLSQPTDQKKGGKLNGFPPIGKIESLTTSDLQPGAGAEVKADSSVTVEYKGAVASTGVIFDSTADHGGQPFTTTLDQVIPGWKGLVGAKAGGIRRLLIPADQAYGPKGACEIPNAADPVKCDKYIIEPNTDLVFDVTILEVK